MRAPCRTFLPATGLRRPYLPSLALDGKEGVDGSSPSEGSTKLPLTGFFVQNNLLSTQSAVGMEPVMELCRSRVERRPEARTEDRAMDAGLDRRCDRRPNPAPVAPVAASRS
jgi:hypothetical protein